MGKYVRQSADLVVWMSHLYGATWQLKTFFSYLTLTPTCLLPPFSKCPVPGGWVGPPSWSCERTWTVTLLRRTTACFTHRGILRTSLYLTAFMNCRWSASDCITGRFFYYSAVCLIWFHTVRPRIIYLWTLTWFVVWNTPSQWFPGA